MRRAFMIVAFAAIVVAGIDPFLLSMPFYDRAALAPAFDRYADRNWQQYAQFLRDAREHTRPGERVAVLVPVTRWDDGYSYAYYRASYFLAGREVLPLFDDADRAHPENLRAADVVAAWRAPVPRTHTKLVWRGDGGVLVRR
ncbi:MAG TPA: hypothetical protein VG323_04440 [Thermoanaerobaculia bacterium]|nr:hypothetical protein [Thermoanaerobaculia bacterium]